MERAVIVIVFCTALVAGVIGFYYGGETAEAYYQRQAINRGYAQHNPTTGQWEWIDAESRQKSRQNVGIEPEEP